MSELRTDFKDEILQEGEEHRVYNIKRKGTDEVVESEVYLEKAYTPQQEGDEFGAKDANEINGRLNGLAPMNELVNGDFQINQRGQRDYNITSGWQYTIDMWKGYNIYLNTANKCVISIVVPETQQGYLCQHLINFENGTYTVTINVPTIHRGKIKFYLEGAGTEQVEITKAGLHSHTFENVNGATKLTLLLDNFYGDLKYIDLFEGDIAYPHQKEDKSIALVRCQDNLLPLITTTGYFGTASYYISDTRIQNMKTKPTCIVEGDVNIRLDGNGYMLNVSSAAVSSNMTEIILSIYNLNDFKDKVINRTVNGWVDGKILISCEPLS